MTSVSLRYQTATGTERCGGAPPAVPGDMLPPSRSSFSPTPGRDIAVAWRGATPQFRRRGQDGRKKMADMRIVTGGLVLAAGEAQAREADLVLRDDCIETIAPPGSVTTQAAERIDAT